MTREEVRLNFFCIPDVEKQIGGIKQIHRHVETLTKLGYNAKVITEKKGFRPKWFDSNAEVLSMDDAIKSEEFNINKTILVIPETYLGIDFSNYFGQSFTGYKRVIFNQNAYYTYGGNTMKEVIDFYHDENTIQVLSISENTHDFLTRNIGIGDAKISRIINGIEDIFTAATVKENLITWMPRKNRDHVEAIINSIAMCNEKYISGWVGKAIEELNHNEVAKLLKKSKIFLSFGHPEGFGLPVAEAMASECWVVGYTGQGGKELFRYGASSCIEFGDWKGFIDEIEKVMKNLKEHPDETRFRTERQAKAIKYLYSNKQEKESIERAWNKTINIFKSAIK